MRSSKRLRAIAAGAVAALACLATVTSMAFARSDALPTSPADEKMDLAGASGGGFGTQAFSPAGCTGRSGAPTRSWDTIAGYAETRCNYNVPRIMVDSTLYRSRWYGWERLHGQRKYAPSSSFVYAATSWWPCAGQHEYMVDSYHESLEGGRYYYGHTQNKATLNCG
jgi:hypothetical protein